MADKARSLRGFFKGLLRRRLPEPEGLDSQIGIDKLCPDCAGGSVWCRPCRAWVCVECGRVFE